ncbi:hypothetical protein CBM2597_U40034 [Cupriavidus taiwanensis]|uniref:Uncharacterized protein n=1 Tax=Cupriavidus taiwanensis TaxID=164546 RepID=A0A7Z7JIM2_9BURK|nr:hypothetical protein CBM2597_U40034 [Cupriavidus taiwanensis]SPC26129.1 hypothetical protein CBM2594_U40034 [Cupriavidus taiwanensis]
MHARQIEVHDLLPLHLELPGRQAGQDKVITDLRILVK